MKLAFKLVSTLMLALIVVTAIHGCLAIEREVRIFEEEAQADAKRLGDALEESVSDAWQRDSHEGVLDLIRNASEYEHTIEIHWVRFDARRGDPYCPTVPPERLTAVVIEEHLTVSATDAGGTPYLHAYWPVDVDPAHEVGLEFSRSTAELEEKKRDVINRTLLLMASMVLLTGLVAALVGIRFVGRPLNRLVDKTRRTGWSTKHGESAPGI